MKSLRRYIVRDAIFFVTVITFQRQPILLRQFEIFQQAWEGRRLDAWVVFPDHFHTVIQVGGDSISDVMHRFKIRYYHLYRRHYGPGRVWQNRFYEHVARDQEDLNKRFDYIHYNPVHHGLVADPFAYAMSSAGLWLERGYYQRDWGVREPITFDGAFGE
jgi:putative transposase